MSFATSQQEEVLKPTEIVCRGSNPIITLLPYKANLLVSHDGQGINVWDLRTGTTRNKIEVVAKSVSVVGSRLFVVHAQEPVIYAHNLDALDAAPHTFSGPSKWVTSIQMVTMADHDTLYASSADKGVYAWRLPSLDAAAETLQPLIKFTGHKDYVNDIEVVGNSLFSASCDKTIKEWDVTSGALHRTFEGHSGWVFNVHIYDGFLYSASKDGTVRQWDLKAGSCSRVFNVEATAFDSYFAPGRVYITDSTNRISCWNMRGKLLHSYEGHSSKLTKVRLLNDDKHIVTASKDNSLRQWSRERGRCVAIYRGHEQPVNDFCIVHGLLYSGSDDGTIRQWHLPMDAKAASSSDLLLRDPRMRAIVTCQAVARRWLVLRTMKKAKSHFKWAQERWSALRSLTRRSTRISKSMGVAEWGFRGPVMAALRTCDNSEELITVFGQFFDVFVNITKLLDAIVLELEELGSVWPFVAGVGAVLEKRMDAIFEHYTSYSANFWTYYSTLKGASEEFPEVELALKDASLECGTSLRTLMVEPLSHMQFVVPRIKDLLRYTLTSSDDFFPLCASLGSLTQLMLGLNATRSLYKKRAYKERLKSRIIFGTQLLQQLGLSEDVVNGELVDTQPFNWSGRKRVLILYSDFLAAAKEKTIKKTHWKESAKGKKKKAVQKVSQLHVEDVVRLDQAALETTGHKFTISTQDPSRYTDRGEGVYTNVVESVDSVVLAEWHDKIALYVAKAQRAIFNIPLEDLIFREDTNIPIVVSSIVTYISEAAKGSFEDILLDKNTDIESAQLNFLEENPRLEGTHTDLLWVLILWLGGLPVPLVPLAQFEALISKRLDPNALRRVLSQLPRARGDLLNYIIRFLQDLCDRSLNKRRSYHLAACVFGPLMLSPGKEHLGAMAHVVPTMVQTFRLMLDNLDDLFPEQVQARKHLLPSYLVHSGTGLVENTAKASGDEASGGAVGLFELLGMPSEPSASPETTASPSRRARNRASVARRGSRRAPKLDPAALETPLTSGWLMVKMPHRKSWKKRWFVLTKSFLRFFKDGKASSALFTFDLRLITIAKAPTSDKPDCFAITMLGEVFQMTGTSTSMTEEWYSAITGAKGKSKGSSNTLSSSGSQSVAAVRAALAKLGTTTSTATSMTHTDGSSNATEAEYAAGTQFVATHNYSSRGDDELTLVKGDRVRLTKATTTLESWWIGECNGREGKFPTLFVRLVDEADAE